MTKFAITIPNKTKFGWEHSPFKNLPSSTPQIKGKLGTEIVMQLLQQEGFDCKIISDKGDLQFGEHKSEVKTALASYNQYKTGEMGFGLWWNQIRPSQDEWTHLHLVAVFADKIDVYEYTREESKVLLSSPIGGLGHVTGDAEGGLYQVSCKKSLSKDSSQLLTITGRLVASIPASKFTISC